MYLWEINMFWSFFPESSSKRMNIHAMVLKNTIKVHVITKLSAFGTQNPIPFESVRQHKLPTASQTFTPGLLFP